MYYAAQYLTTDASRLHKAMDEYHKFIIHEWREEPKPKFKVGDCIRPIDSCLGSQRTICEVCDGWYVTNQGTLDFEYEDNWELVEDSVHRTKAEVDAAMQDVEEKSKAFTDAKEQMMANAVDGVVHHFEKCKVACVYYNDPTGVPMAYFTSPEGLSVGDKVKVIVIKKK